MSAPKFTPGRWSVSSDDKLNPERAYGITVPWIDGEERGTVVIAEVTHADSDERAKADAHLLAAAPDLYAALQKIDANAAESVEWIRRVARAALRKAEGGAR